MKIILFFTILLSFNVSGQTTSDPPYKAARGHYFYEEPQVKPDNKDAEPELQKPVIPSRQVLMTMPPKQFAKLFQEQLEWAITTTAEQDVQQFWQMVDVSRRRSRAFMGVTEFVMMRNPQLDMRTVDPINAPGRNEKLRQTEEAKRRKLFEYADRFALVMFAAPGCGACKAQMGILDVFQRQYGFPVRVVDVAANQSLARKHGVSQTPHTILISRDSPDWMPIGVGIRALPVIVNKTYAALRLLSNEIAPAQFYNIEIDGGELYDPLYPLNKEEGL